MTTLLLSLALLGQAPAPDYDFMELGKKVDNLTTTAERATKRLELVEDKLNTILDRLDKSPTAPVAKASGPVGDDDAPWQMNYRVENDGKEHFYVKDSSGRSRHFERPVAAAQPAPAAYYPPTATATTTASYYAPPALATTYYPAASPGYVSGATPVYTGGTVVRRGLFRGRGYSQVCNGTSCQLVPN